MMAKPIGTIIIAVAVFEIHMDKNPVATMKPRIIRFIFEIGRASCREGEACHTRSKRDWSSDVCSSDLPKHHCFTKSEVLHGCVNRGIILQRIGNLINDGQTNWYHHHCSSSIRNPHG